VEVAGGQRDDAIRVRGVGQRRQARGADRAFRQDDGLPGVGGRVNVAAAVRLGDECSRPGPGDDNSLPAELGESSRDGERADVAVLDDPARGRQLLTGAEPSGLALEPLLELVGAAIVFYER
jgi:hypothetical protein